MLVSSVGRPHAAMAIHPTTINWACMLKIQSVWILAVSGFPGLWHFLIGKMLQQRASHTEKGSETDRHTDRERERKRVNEIEATLINFAYEHIIMTIVRKPATTTVSNFIHCAGIRSLCAVPLFYTNWSMSETRIHAAHIIHYHVEACLITTVSARFCCRLFYDQTVHLCIHVYTQTLYARTLFRQCR